MELLNRVRFYLLIALIAVSIYLIFSPYVLKKSGVVVTLLDKDNKCSNINEGSTMNQVSGTVISNSQDFESITKVITAGEYVPMVVNGGPAGCTAVRDGYLGLEVSDVSNSQMKLSIGLGGGFLTKLKFADVDVAQSISNIMNNRISLLKLASYKAETEGNVIKITSLSNDISFLTKQCKFEIGVSQQLTLKGNGTYPISLNGNTMNVTFYDSTFKINGIERSLNESFIINGIETSFRRESNSTLLVKQIFVNNDDVRIVGRPVITYISQVSSFRLQLPLYISGNASQEFQEIIKGVKSVLVGGVNTLNANFVYNLDGKTIAEIPIPSDIAKQNITVVSVLSLDKSLKDLEKTSSDLSVCLDSGIVEQNFEKVSVDVLKPTEIGMVEYSVAGVLVTAISVSFVLVQMKYKTYRYWYASVGAMAAELVISIAFVALAQGYTTFIIDYTTIIGLAIFGAVSVGQMLFGMMFILKKGEFSLSYRTKKFNKINFFMTLGIFISAIVILFLDRGFGFVMLFGSIIGILLTKPLVFSELSKTQA